MHSKTCSEMLIAVKRIKKAVEIKLTFKLRIYIYTYLNNKK